MTDPNISALKDEVHSLNTTLARLGEKIGDMDLRLRQVDDWVRLFWVKSLAIGAIVLVNLLLAIAMITHG